MTCHVKLLLDTSDSLPTVRMQTSWLANAEARPQGDQ